MLAGFTHCPDVCPFTLANLEQVVAELGLRVRPDRLPTVIFLGVDPDRDRANLKDYVDPVPSRLPRRHRRDPIRSNAH